MVSVLSDSSEHFDQRALSEDRFHICTRGTSCKLPRSILMTVGLENERGLQMAGSAAAVVQGEAV